MIATHILVTRPQSQGTALCARLRERGFSITHIPVMEIAPLTAPEQLAHIDNIFSDIVRYHGLILISVNAAETAMPWMKKYPPLSTTHLYTVGKSTACFLEHQIPQRHVIFPQQDMSSEGLLALPDMQQDRVAGKRFLIVRGKGGRELLSEQLTTRGAVVESCELYCRTLPMQNTPALQRALPSVDILLINSSESLENLLTLSHETSSLADKVMLVPSERIAEAARRKGFRHIITSSNATDEAVISALSAYCEEHP